MIHAGRRAAQWLEQWRRSGRLVLLLDFDGTLAPIVDRPHQAELSASAGRALGQLCRDPSAEIAIISGRSLEDVRDRVGIPRIHYAGNHGMEVAGPLVNLSLPPAVAARPQLAAAARRLSAELCGIPGAEVEDKGLTLTVHFRRAENGSVPRIREAVSLIAAAFPGLAITEGKMVLEVRPRVEWGKGEAVELLLSRLQPPQGSMVLYIGDDRTDEDAFRAVLRWEHGCVDGVIVAAPPFPESAASCYLESPAQVGVLLSFLAGDGPPPAVAEA